MALATQVIRSPSEQVAAMTRAQRTNAVARLLLQGVDPGDAGQAFGFCRTMAYKLRLGKGQRYLDPELADALRDKFGEEPVLRWQYNQMMREHQLVRDELLALRKENDKLRILYIEASLRVTP